MLQSFFIGPALNLKVDIHVVFQTAEQINKFFQGRHGDCVIIIHRNAAEHPLRRFTDLIESARIKGAIVVIQSAAAIQRRVELINPLYVRNLRIRVARKRNQICAVFGKVDRENDHDVGMPLRLAALLFPFCCSALVGIVDADQKDVDDILHHGFIRLLNQNFIGILCRRGFRRACRPRFGRAGIRRRFVRRNDQDRLTGRRGVGFDFGRGPCRARSAAAERAARPERAEDQRRNDAKQHGAAGNRRKQYDLFLFCHIQSSFRNLFLNHTLLIMKKPFNFRFVTNILQKQRIFIFLPYKHPVSFDTVAKSEKKAFFSPDLCYTV